MCRLVEMIEARPEIGLGVVRLAEAANGEQTADRVRQAELVLELRDDAGSGSCGNTTAQEPIEALGADAATRISEALTTEN